MEAPVAVRLTGITRAFPRVIANRNVSLQVERGEIHAIVGENGAGKSTLMKILYGLETPDAGEIQVLGRRLHHHSPAEAIAAGVGMVFQHFVLLPTLTVAENILLGNEPRLWGLLYHRSRAEELVRQVSRKFGLALDPQARVETLPVGLQQRVEILKVLVRGAEVIILDEPTAVLTPQEAEELTGVMRRLATQGKAVIFITHKLREVLAGSDRVTVLRAGEVQGTCRTAETTLDELAQLMVGRRLEAPVRSAGSAAAVTLEVRRLCARSDRGPPALREVSFQVRAGEILGVAGVQGNGQTELVECLAGLRTVTSGSVTLRGKDLTRATPRARYDAGLGHIPADRHRLGAVAQLTVAENAMLGRQWRKEFSRFGWLRRGAARRHALQIIHDCDVRPPDPEAPFGLLSGGNQQKLVVGRELARRPELLLAAHPTRGLDAGATEFVHRRLLAARERGCACLLVSSDLDELLALSDRVVVLHAGRITGAIDPSRVDEQELGRLMAGIA